MRYSVLGSLRVEEGGEELPIGGAKRRALLALLLLNADRVVSSERLIDELWEGEPPDTAASTLQSHVHNLRRALGGDRLKTRGSGYVLEVGDDELDATDFEAELVSGSAALASGDAPLATEILSRALARWRGTAYADVAGASWVTAEATRLEEARAVTLERLLDARLAAGADAEVVGRAEAAVVEHPYRERFWVQLITALYREGRQAEALRAYQRIRTLLDEELGIEPSAELRELEQAVLVQSSSLARPEAGSEFGTNVSPSASMPSGVVTFLLTDVVGSTHLWDTNAAGMDPALARHDAIIRGAVDTYGGLLLKARGEGDSTFSVFRRATDAVAAARAANRGLAAEVWPSGIELRVRMAVHTGEAVERDGDYYGPAVNRVARLRSLADGGQILMSRSTTEVVIDHLPDDCQLVELGPRELQDLARPETIYLLATPIATSTTRVAEQHGSEQPPFPTALSGPPFGFHGRTEERRRFDQDLKEVAAGTRRVVFVAGEPGIGKTSLVGAVARDAYAAGFTVLYGRCDEELGLPYRPWVEALGSLIEEVDQGVLESMGRRRLANLARVFPEVQERVRVLEKASTTDAEAERYLFFGAVVALLEAATSSTPLVLVLDDLHWADKPTLSLLRHVVTASGPIRTLLVGTYRHNELSAEHPLADALASLRREYGVERLTLHGLADDELVAVVEAAAGQRFSGAELELVHAVHRETEGNPFFAWELVLHLNESGAVSLSESGQWLVSGEINEVTLPDSVREVIGRRIARLGDDVKRVLTTAAHVGREFDLDLVSMASDSDPDDLLELLERAEASGLVTSVARDRFSFSHALVHYTLYQDLNPTRKARIHRKIAESIEQLDRNGTRVTELARHWAEAVQPAESDRAIDYARQSGDQALRALAPDEAIRWFRQGLNLLNEFQSDNDESRCELLLGLGEAQRAVGDVEFRANMLEAASLAQRLGDKGRLVRSALGNTRFSPGAGVVDADRIAVLESAIQAVGPEDSIERARLLTELAYQLLFDKDHHRRTALLDDALALARRIGDPSTIVDVIWKLCQSTFVPWTLEKRRVLSAEAVSISEAIGDPLGLWGAMLCRVTCAFEEAELDEVDHWIERAEQVALEIGQPYLLLWATQFRLVQALNKGNFDEAEGLTTETYERMVATGELDGLTMFGAQLLWVRWHQGRLAEFIDLFTEAVESTPELPAFKSGLDLALVEAGRGSEVAIDLHDIEEMRHDGAWSAGMTVWADVASDLGDLKAAQVIFDRLAPFSSLVAYNMSMGTGAIAHYLGRLSTVLRRFDEADAYFQQGLEVNQRLGDPFYVARTELGWGRMLLERAGPGDVERGISLIEQARDRAERYGCAAVARTAVELLAP